MSTEETTERPRRHRLTVISVAAAVLVAGGGAAYLVSGTADDDTAADGPRARPTPLALDGIGPQERGTQERGTGSRSDIAPGEPDPAGGAYRAKGELPKGPDAAPVYRTGDRVAESEVAALAEALGMKGSPEHKSGRWTVADGKDGSGPSLTVAEEHRTGSWHFSRHAAGGDGKCGAPQPERGELHGTPSCQGASGKTPGSSTGSGGGEGDPVSAAKAKDAVRPVLKAMKLDDARLDASSVNGALRVVSATPRLDGQPVRDWGATFTVGGDGQLVVGHGQLGKLTKGAEYPVLTAGETLKELNKKRGNSSASARCAAPEKPSVKPSAKPGDGSPGDSPATPAPEPCGPAGPPRPVTVADAEFGLATQFSEGKPVLVPSWIFAVERKGGGDTYEVTHPAVEPEYLVASGGGGGDRGDADPDTGAGEGSDSKRQTATSYRAEGRTLTVTFWGGVCHDYQGKAKAAKEKVTVSVEPRGSGSEKPCIAMAKKQTVKVTLDEPLGDRTVVDARDGEKLPRK